MRQACDRMIVSTQFQAMAGGIDANLVQCWRRLAREGGEAIVAKRSEVLAMAPRAPGRPRRRWTTT
jgi:transposase-like protein